MPDQIHKQAAPAGFRAMTDLDDDLLEMGIRRIDQLKAERGADWLYEGLIPFEAFGILLGDSGIGKSTVAVDLAVAVATATPFAGYEYGGRTSRQNTTSAAQLPSTRKPCTVLYIYGEGGPSLDARINAARDARRNAFSREQAYLFAGQDISELPILPWELACTTEGPTSLRSVVGTFLRKEHYMTIARQSELPIGLIVVDTWAAVAGLTNENDNTVTQERVNSLRELSNATGCAVLVVAHTKKGTDEMRGATSVVNAADFVLRIDRRRSRPDSLSLLNLKSRHGPTQAPAQFRLAQADGASSLDVDSPPPLIVEWLDDSNAQLTKLPVKTTQAKPADRHSTAPHGLPGAVERDGDKSSFDVYMEAASLAVMGHGVSDAIGFLWTTPAEIRREFDRMYQRSAEANRKAFERAQNRAIDEGRVAVSTVDGGRQFVRIVE